MNVRDEGFENKDTSRSDISQNTNIKVFNGYGGDNVLAQLNSQHIKQPSSPKNKKSKSSSKQVFSVLRSMPLNSDTGTIKNPLIDVISFGNGNLFQKNLNKEFATNTNIEEDKESNNSRHSRTSKTSKNSYNSRRSLSVNDPLENMNNQFITTEGIIGNDDYANDHDPLSKSPSSPHENLFSKLQKTMEDQETKMHLFNDHSLTHKPFCKIPDKIIDSFTVSTIEKGVALLVSNDDCIFTLPTLLLPKGIKPGNVYTFSIEKEETKEEAEEYIKEIQSKYIEKQ